MTLAVVVALALFGPGAVEPVADDAFWDLSGRIDGLRTQHRDAEARGLLSELEALAREGTTPDLLLVNALGQRVHVLVNLGQPDLATAPREEMLALVDEVDAIGEAPTWVFFTARVFDVPYRLAVLDFEGAIASVDAARADPRWEDENYGGSRRQLLTNRAQAFYALARQDPARIPNAIEVLREQAAADPKNLLYLAQLELARGHVPAARRALDDAAARLARKDGAPPLLLEIMNVRITLAEGASDAPLRAARDRLAMTYRRNLDRWSAASDEGGVGLLHFGDRRDAISELVDSTLALDEGTEAALAWVAETQERSTLSRRLGGAGTTVAALRSEVLEDETHVLLCWIPTTVRSHLFVVTKDGVAHHGLDGTHDLKRVRDRVMGFVDRRLDDRDRERLAKRVAGLTSEMLPADVVERLRTSRKVTICAVATLASVPFELLTVVGDRPLSVTHALDHVPSLPVALALARAGVDTEARGVTLVAGPLPSDEAKQRWPEVDALPFDDESWRDVVGAYPADVRRVDVGPAATRDAIAAGGAVLHVFAHGVLDETLVRPATLVLTPATAGGDGLFSCRDAERLGAPRLVFLAACGASAGPYRGGDEEAQGFGGAFLTAGAAAVVVSARRIEARATLALSTRFHERLASGDSPAEALRRARAALLEEGRFVDPVDHAHLRVIGLGQRPVFRTAFPETPRGRALGWGVGLALGVVGLLGLVGLALLFGRRSRSL